MAGNHRSGRRPKSTALKLFEGSRQDRINHEEPRHPPLTEAFDVPPAELDKNSRARTEWRRLAPLLRQSGQVAEADRAGLVALCLEWSRYIDATIRVRRNGVIVPGANGTPTMNPYLGVATKALASCARLWPELGLTPSSRSRLKAATAPPEDRLRAFLARRGTHGAA